PSILKTERPPRYRAPISWLAHREPVAQTFARSALPRERVRSSLQSRYPAVEQWRAIKSPRVKATLLYALGCADTARLILEQAFR
ncbi:hypothetical protein, partial [Hyphomicrobium sp.]|uniref:hypothetical protein n=1 Tax=Hyphomicrobium sp. TaxID=82 RepID=UPI0025B99158